MRRAMIVLLCVLLAAPCALAEDDVLFAWMLELGGDGVTSPSAMVTASSGGVFIAGYTTSEDVDEFREGFGDKDGLVLRVDASGKLRWWQRLGGSGDDTLTAIAETPDGGCVALGVTASVDGDARASRGEADAWLVRINAMGEVLWSKTLGGSLDDELTNVLVTEEGMYFVCGRTQSRNGDLGANHGGWDAWATLLSDEDGKPLWTYRYGFGGDDAFTAAIPIHDGWLLIGEVAEEITTDSEGEPIYRKRPIAQMVSQEGEPSWEEAKLLGDTGENILHTIAEIETGWLLAGESNSRSALMPTSYGDKDIWVLQMRQNGSVAWQRTYGGGKEEKLHTIRVLPSGGFALLGETKSTDGQVFGAHGEADVWLLQTNASGVLEWQQPIGGSDETIPAGLLYMEDGSFLVGGTTVAQDGDIGRHISVRTGFLSLLGPNGNLLWTQTVMQNEECTLLQTEAQDGYAYALGSIRTIRDGGPAESIWISRLRMEGFVSE